MRRINALDISQADVEKARGVLSGGLHPHLGTNADVDLSGSSAVKTINGVVSDNVRSQGFNFDRRSPQSIAMRNR